MFPATTQQEFLIEESNSFLDISDLGITLLVLNNTGLKMHETKVSLIKQIYAFGYVEHTLIAKSAFDL